MSDNYLNTYFVYQEGSTEKIRAKHTNAFKHHEIFEGTAHMIKSDVFNVRISDNDVPGITNMSYLDNYRYETQSEEWDLSFAPLIKYYLADINALSDGGTDTTESENARLNTLVEIVKTGYQATKDRPVAVFSVTPQHGFRIDQAEQTPFTAESLAHNQYHHLSWLTIFTPPMVNQYGRKTLLSAPAWKIEELDDGAILVVCHNDVSDWDDDCQAVAEHIGLPSYEDIG